MSTTDNVRTIRELSRSLPEVEEGTAYGTPAFRVRGKLIARMLEDQATLVLRTDFDTRDFLIQVHPESFYMTDHYRNYAYVLVRMAAVSRDELKAHLERAWRLAAPKRLAASYVRGTEDEDKEDAR